MGYAEYSLSVFQRVIPLFLVHDLLSKYGSNSLKMFLRKTSVECGGHGKTNCLTESHVQYGVTVIQCMVFIRWSS